MGIKRLCRVVKVCCLTVWWLTCHIIAVRTDGAATWASQHSSSVSWFVQLSDLHINKWTHHEIVPDLKAFGQQVLASTRPGAVLITGDLVDAKTRPEGSQQHKEEWQAYEHAWQQLARSAQLPPSAILDLRGNHDVFDTLRNSRDDLFALHSATAAAHGQEKTAHQRIWLRQLQPQVLLPPAQLPQQQQQQQRNLRRSGSGEHRHLLSGSSNDSTSSGTALFNAQVEMSQELSAAGRAALSTAGKGQPQQQAAAAAACPAAVLLGLDFTPNLGLHSPANFFGVAGLGLLQELQQQLQRLRSHGSSSDTDPSALLPPGCSRHVPVISYSHYPFSTVAGAYGSSSKDASGIPVQGGRAVRDLLRLYDVSAHLSGHLHDLLGPRMQAMYRKQGSTAYLADWEAADWKQRRRWRLLAVDSGAASFADLHFRRSYCSIAAAAAGACRPSSSSNSGGSEGSSSSTGHWYEVSSVDSSRVVSQHVVMLTWPPDGRYSPLSAVQPGSSSSSSSSSRTDAGAQIKDLEQQQNQDNDLSAASAVPSTTGSTYEHVLPVRVLVVPLQLQGSTSATQLVGVTLEWFCQGSASDWTAGLSTKGKPLGSATMYPVGTAAAAAEGFSSDGAAGKEYVQDDQGNFPYDLSQPQVFAAGLPVSSSHLALQCGSSSSSGGVLVLQVTVRDNAGGASTSELRPVVLAHILSSSSSSAGDEEQQGLSGAAAAATDGHLPLPSSIAEETLLTFDGQRFSVQLFMTGWLSQFVGLLLLPRWLARWILAASARLNSSSSSSSSRLLRHQQSMQQYQLQEQYKRSFSLSCRSVCLLGSAKAIWWLVCRGLRSTAIQCGKVLLMPFVSMAVLAQQHTGVWWAMLGHCIWAFAGPWFCARMSSSSKGLGLWFRYGMFLPLPADLAPAWINGDVGSPFYDGDVSDGVLTGEDRNIDVDGIWQEYKWISIPDTHLVSSLTACLVLAPLTLWSGLVVRHWHAVAAAAARCSGASSSNSVAAAVAAAAAVSDGGPEADSTCITADSRTDQQSTNGFVITEIQLQQQAGGLISTMSSSSSDAAGTPTAAAAGADSNTSGAVKGSHRLSHSRSTPAARCRNSGDLLAANAAAAAAVGDGTPQDMSTSSSSCDPGEDPGVKGNDECSSSSSDMAAARAAQEEAQLLLRPAAAGGGRAAAPSAATPALNFAWFTRLLPNSSSDTKVSRLSPRYLACCVLYVVLLAVLPAWRAVQLCLVSIRIPLPLLLLAAPVWAFWYKLCWRLAAAYGPVALLLNPVIGWLPVLVVCMLRSVRQQLTAGKARHRE